MKNHSIIDNQRNIIENKTEKFCPVISTIDVLTGKWKMRILWELRYGVKRFGQLKDDMQKVTPAVLSTQLQALVTEGIISRSVYAEIPPKVEYELTETGRSLIAVICAMETWGINYGKFSGVSHNRECLWNEL
jgi:DNA-binding HxlR family transcriptional regulator